MIDAWEETRNRRGPKGYGRYPCWRASYLHRAGTGTALAVMDGETCLEAVAAVLECAAKHAAEYERGKEANT